jgi:hypothetical protein
MRTDGKDRSDDLIEMFICNEADHYATCPRLSGIVEITTRDPFPALSVVIQTGKE